MTVLEVVRRSTGYRGFVGRPQKDRGTLARVFVAKAALDLPTIVGPALDGPSGFTGDRSSPSR